MSNELRIILIVLTVMTALLAWPLEYSGAVAAEASTGGSVGAETRPVMELPDFPPGNQQFYQWLRPVLETHERIHSARQAVEAAREDIRVALGQRYPHLELWAEGGREDSYLQDYPDSYSTFNLRLRQLLYDFGKTDAVIEKSRRQFLERELTLEQTRRRLILDAATAWQNLHKSYMVLQFARESEENVRLQTGLEEVRVAEGAGYTTDVLQAKYQLAAAVARRLRSEGDYNIAESIWLEYFPTLPKDIRTLYPLDPGLSLKAPLTLEQALVTAQQNNTGLLLARNRQRMAELDQQQERRQAWFPDVNLILESAYEDNYSGVYGVDRSYKAMVEFRKSINLGLTERNRIRAAGHHVAREQYQTADLTRIIETGTRTAWQRFKTAEATAETLARQAELTAAFLELARIERVLGTRSLMDILAGETSLINARSDSYAARVDISLALLGLLETMGLLELEMFRSGAS